MKAVDLKKLDKTITLDKISLINIPNKKKLRKSITGRTTDDPKLKMIGGKTVDSLGNGRWWDILKIYNINVMITYKLCKREHIQKCYCWQKNYKIKLNYFLII